MDSSVEGAGLNSPNCTTLSLEERRDLIHALLNQPDEASQVLHSWSRHDILKILCLEMGKERKYTGLTKSKLVENLLNLMSRSPTASGRRNSKRKQKTDSSESSDTVFCENSACRAVLGHEDEFCKRCSCCVCRKYDDNKDPSLWLTCGSELPCERDGCGLSCHLECALRHERSGIGRDGERGRLDGRFYCVSCGEENDLLGCWRKQMKVAKETRRVDILCHRVSLGQKLLRGTSKHRKLLAFMDEAAQKLEADVGPLLGSPLNMARGIVNRLCSGPHVQELCSLALDSLDKMLSDSVSSQGTDQVHVRLEEVRARSITVSTDSQESSSQSGIRGFRLFCRKSMDEMYSTQETSVLYLPDTRSTITGLDPETKFCLKAVAFNAEGELGASELRFSTLGDEDEASNSKLTERSQSPLTNSSGLCNPSSVEDESNNAAPFIVQNSRRDDKDNNNNVGSHKEIEACNAGEADSTLEVSELGEARLVEGNTHDKRVKIEGDLPVTPCKTDTQGKKKWTKRSKSDTETGAKMMEEHEKRSTTGKTRGNTDNEVYNANGVPDKDMVHAVKMIRCLEQEGHIDKCFRERFLTWYSSRATHREIWVVKLFIDTFAEDLASLGEQLVDTFSECILSKRSTAFVPAGICLKLWH